MLSALAFPWTTGDGNSARCHHFEKMYRVSSTENPIKLEGCERKNWGLFHVPFPHSLHLFRAG